MAVNQYVQIYNQLQKNLVKADFKYSEKIIKEPQNLMQIAQNMIRLHFGILIYAAICDGRTWIDLPTNTNTENMAWQDFHYQDNLINDKRTREQLRSLQALVPIVKDLELNNIDQPALFQTQVSALADQLTKQNIGITATTEKDWIHLKLDIF